VKLRVLALALALGLFPLASGAEVVEYIAGGRSQKVDATHPLPTTSSGGGGTSEVNITEVGGNAVTTTIPVSGSVTVSDGAGALNVIVDSSALPSGAATAAKQPALGTAGSASSDVITVQGVTSMTPLKVDGSGVTQPVSGTVTATVTNGTVSGTGTAGSAATGVLTVQGIASATPVSVDSPETLAVSGSVSSAATLFTIDLSGYSSFSWQFTSIGSSNAFTAEMSSDNSNWVGALCVASDNVSGSTVGSGTSISSTNRIYICPKIARYGRVRVSTYSSGTVTAVGQASRSPWQQGYLPVSISTSNGTVPVSIGSTVTVGGNVASNASDSGNPLKVGCVFNSGNGIPTPLTTGQRGDCQATSNGWIVVSPQLLNTSGFSGGGMLVANDGMNRAEQQNIPVFALSAQCDDTSPTALTENRWGNGRLDCTTHALKVNIEAATAGGVSVYTLQPAASDNHANIKNGAGQVYAITAFNNSATINYVRLYNAASGFNGCNSATNLVWSGHIPASTSDAGFVVDFATPIAFSTGISICVTGAYGQTNTTNATASAIDLNVNYK
jgi:hypothetical protein